MEIDWDSCSADLASPVRGDQKERFLRDHPGITIFERLEAEGQGCHWSYELGRWAEGIRKRPELKVALLCTLMFSLSTRADGDRYHYGYG